MRILCGILTGFICLMLLFFIFASGGDAAVLSVVMTFYGGTAVVLLWLAAGQPSTFTTAAAIAQLTIRQRRFRGVMRIAAGVFGVPLAVQLIAIVTDSAWKAISAARTGASGIGDLSMALEYLPVVAVWWAPQGLTAWVLLRFAFRGRPLPPITPSLIAAAPSPDPSTIGNENEILAINDSHSL